MLLRWATSRLGLRRSAFGAFRKLLTFLAYADPGTPEAPNQLLRSMRYEPDHPVVTADPGTCNDSFGTRAPGATGRSEEHTSELQSPA